MPTARELGRAGLTAEIKASARAQLAHSGAAGLSLRAIARDLGLVSSALYRYFPSRDHLLTALILDAYNALGEVAERADAAARREGAPLARRWLVVGQAVRTWAVAHPAEYALVFGSPVPGYAAPAATIAAAGRVTELLIGMLQESVRQGGRAVPAATAGGVHTDLEAARSAAGIDVPAGLLERGVFAWTAMFGTISFELFGHYEGSVARHADEWFDATMHTLAEHLGFRDAG